MTFQEHKAAQLKIVKGYVSLDLTDEGREEIATIQARRELARDCRATLDKLPQKLKAHRYQFAKTFLLNAGMSFDSAVQWASCIANRDLI